MDFYLVASARPFTHGQISQSENQHQLEDLLEVGLGVSDIRSKLIKELHNNVFFSNEFWKNDDFLKQRNSEFIVSAEICCKLSSWRLVVTCQYKLQQTCQFHQLATSLLIKVRFIVTCHLQTCYNLLKPLVASSILAMRNAVDMRTNLTKFCHLFQLLAHTEAKKFASNMLKSCNYNNKR